MPTEVVVLYLEGKDPAFRISKIVDLHSSG
jgi:hypothetical protein